MLGGKSLQARQERIAWVFVVPALLVVLVVGLYPLISTIYLSFTDATRDPTQQIQFIGLRNYTELFAERDFWNSVLNTIVFTASSVVAEFVLGLFFALIVHSEFRGRGGMRAAMLIPWALPTVVAARMWGLMLDQFGVVNDILAFRLNLFDEPPVWTLERGLAMATVVAVDVWKTTPFVALILLAGLQLIPGGLYEAAQVDGANRRQTFFKVTLPLLKPAILVALIFRTLDALRVFDAIWILTGGESGTESMATYNYRTLFEYLRVGYGSAISVMIFLIIALFVVVYVSTVRVEEAA